MVRCFLIVSNLVHTPSVFFESLRKCNHAFSVCFPFSLDAAHIHPHSAPNRSPLNMYLALATSIEPVHPPFLTFISLLSEHVCRPRKRVQAPFEPVHPSSKHIGRYLWCMYPPLRPSFERTSSFHDVCAHPYVNLIYSPDCLSPLTVSYLTDPSLLLFKAYVLFRMRIWTCLVYIPVLRTH